MNNIAKYPATAQSFSLPISPKQNSKTIIPNPISMAQLMNFLQEPCYYQLSDLLLQSYTQGQQPIFRPEFKNLDAWMEQETTHPILLHGEPLSGKKTFLCEYINYLKSKNDNLFILPEFSSISPIFSEVLYKIMVDLRTKFNIQQKVELNQEKLRRYFKYWLEITSDLIQKNYIGYTSEEKQKIVIIIEGLDGFVDSAGNHVSPFFWLPQEIPSNVKLILSANSNGMAHENLKGKVKEFVLDLSSERSKRILNALHPSLRDSYPKMKLCELELTNKLMTVNPSFKPEITDFHSILEQYIQKVTDKDLNLEKIRSLLLCLVLSNKGLRKKELVHIVQLDSPQLDRFCLKFGALFTQKHDFYIICQRYLKEELLLVLKCSNQKIKNYHMAINKIIKKQPTSVRKLEEQIHHLKSCENYIELKEVISKIENFLILYTPTHKYLLCSCWFKLENHLQYDPVFEYNKAVESFLNHFYPKEEDIFKIVFQICLFFKEYSEFENYRTPEFRHPLIRGQANQFEEISVYNELKGLKMVGKIKTRHLQLKKVTEKNQEEGAEKEERSQKKRKSKISKKQIQPQKEEQAKPIEKLNVKIESNQQKFREFYLKRLKSYLNEYFVPYRKNKNNNKECSIIDDQYTASDQENDQKCLDYMKIKNNLLLKNFQTYIEQNYHRNGQEQKYYYYKQWIWVQFPWICQSLQHNYSDLIKDCITSSTEYMSVDMEYSLVRDVIKITKVAKKNKKEIYDSKSIELMPLTGKSLTGRSNRESQEPQSRIRMIEDQDSRVNLAKYKLNLSKIDQEIQQQESMDKSKHQSRSKKAFFNSMANSEFLTEVRQPLKESKKVEFPRISAVKRNAMKQNNPCESKMVLRKVNDLKHQNTRLIERVEELKKTELMLDGLRDIDNEEKLKKQIRELELKKKKMVETMETQQKLKVKLESIIKICDINKKHGADSEKLNSFLNSLKYMVGVEEKVAGQTKHQLIKDLEMNRSQIKNLKDTKKKVEKDMRDFRERKTERMKTSQRRNSPKRNLTIFPIHSDSPKKVPVKSVHKNKPKNIKVVEQYSYEDIIYGEFSIAMDQDEQNKVILKQFSDDIEKEYQLVMKIRELKDDINSSNVTLKKLREETESRRIGQESLKEATMKEIMIAKKDYLKTIKQRNDFLEKCLAQAQPV